MKRFLFPLILIITLQVTARAEGDSRVHNVYVNWFESINLVSVNYDTRFSRSSVFGWHTGVGFVPSHFGGVSLPTGVNAIWGNRASKFEIGVTVAPYTISWKESEVIRGMDGDTYYEYTKYYGPKKWYFGMAVGFNIGYRLQRKSGFFFRTGLSPVFAPMDPLALLLLNLMPFFSFGYTF